MIANPIRYPIGSDRPNPNRPRIARIESARVVPITVAGLPSMASGRGWPSTRREHLSAVSASVMDVGCADGDGGVR